MANQVKSFIAAKTKALLQAWQHAPAAYVASFAKGPDLISGDMLTGWNAAGTAEIDLIGADSSDRVRIGGSLFNPLRSPVVLRVQPTASQATKFPFWVKGATVEPAEIDSIWCTFDTADGAANTGYITKDGAGVAPGAGVAVQSGTFNLNATANTVQQATIAVRGTAALALAPGDGLTFNIASAVTNLKGLVVVVWMKQHVSIPAALAYFNAAASVVTKTIYLNVIPGLTVSGVAMRWSALGTDAGAVTLDVTKDTSTNAPGAGTTILAAAVSLKGAINTTVYPAMSATASVLAMAYGDRLAVKLTGTATAVAGLVVSVQFASGVWRELVIQDPHILNQNVDQTMFIADGYYEVLDDWGTWSTISTSVKALLTKDGGTTAPGAGTALITDNSSAGLDTNATANTPVEGTLNTIKPVLILAPGDRLGEKFTGTTGSLAGLCRAVRLRRL